MRNRISLIFILIVLSISNLFAFDKTGTTAATFLQIPVSSRFAALGNAGVAGMGNAEQLALNPASVKFSRKYSFSLSHMDWFADLQHQSVSFVMPVSENSQMGIQLISFGGDEFEQTTINDQEGNGVMVDYGDLAVGLSGITRLTDRFTVGMTGKYIRQDMFNEKASTFAFDIGTMLVTSLKGFSIGMSMTNLGGEMQLEGRDLYVDNADDGATTVYETSKWSLPLMFRTGVAWNLLGNQGYYSDSINSLNIFADARHLNEGITTLHLGTEYGFNETIFARIGNTSGHDSEDWTFGAGVKLNLYQYLVFADFAYIDLGDLDTVQRITLSFRQK